MEGLIFDIQRFSVHDGPGIRTTVFMKGCPLHCKWCHNPEGLSARQQLQHFEEKCIGCGRCGDRSNLSIIEKCPAKALTVCGRTVTKEETLKEILKDRIFYKDDGGVTFSGGECLCQADFVQSVLQEVKALGIHTAIDTSGYVTWDSIEKTLESCDLYLYDIKCIDPILHRKNTGVDNGLILKNLERLSALGREIWARIPVIPQFNATEKEMNAIAEFIASLDSISQATLIPYNVLGVEKYKSLGLIYSYDTNERVTKEELVKFKEIFQKKHILVR